MSSELQRIQHRLLASLKQVSTVRPELEQQAGRLRQLAAQAHHLLDGSSRSSARALDAILREAVAKCVGASQQLGAAKATGERWANQAGWLAKAAAVSAGGTSAGTLARVDGLERNLAESVRVFEQRKEDLRVGPLRAPDAAVNSTAAFLRINREIFKKVQESTSAGSVQITPIKATTNLAAGDHSGMMALVLIFVVTFKGLFGRRSGDERTG